MIISGVFLVLSILNFLPRFLSFPWILLTLASICHFGIVETILQYQFNLFPLFHFSYYHFIICSLHCRANFKHSASALQIILSPFYLSAVPIFHLFSPTFSPTCTSYLLAKAHQFQYENCAFAGNRPSLLSVSLNCLPSCLQLCQKCHETSGSFRQALP